MGDVAPNPAPKGKADDWLDLVRNEERRGDYLRAFDLSVQGIREHPTDNRLRYRAVLTIARAGGLRQARELLGEFGFTVDDENEDVACLAPRLLKDEALGASDARRPLLARQSAELYRKVFERTGGYYPGINSAAMYCLAGDAGAAQSFAARVLASVRDTASTG